MDTLCKQGWDGQTTFLRTHFKYMQHCKIRPLMKNISPSMVVKIEIAVNLVGSNVWFRVKENVKLLIRKFACRLQSKSRKSAEKWKRGNEMRADRRCKARFLLWWNVYMRSSRAMRPPSERGDAWCCTSAKGKISFFLNCRLSCVFSCILHESTPCTLSRWVPTILSESRT